MLGDEVAFERIQHVTAALKQRTSETGVSSELNSRVSAYLKMIQCD